MRAKRVDPLEGPLDHFYCPSRVPMHPQLSEDEQHQTLRGKPGASEEHVCLLQNNLSGLMLSVSLITLQVV